MKPIPEELLDELIEDAAPPEFRTAVLEQTLRQARRRKQVRRLNSACATIAIIAIAAWLLRPSPPGTTVLNPSRPPDLIVVHSRPLNPAQLVSTQPHGVPTVASASTTCRIVETQVSE